MQPEDVIKPVIDNGYVRNEANYDSRSRQQGCGGCDARRSAEPCSLRDARTRGSSFSSLQRKRLAANGAKAFDTGRFTARTGFVFDHAAPVGDIVQRAPFQTTLDVTFVGRKAHAGIAPEEGRSAIAAAAKAVSELRLGRLDAQTTSNVGLISGGTARNIVPDHCELVAEARSLDEPTLRDVVGEMVDSIGFAASVGRVAKLS